MLVSAFIFVVLFIGSVAGGVFCIVPGVVVLVQFGGAPLTAGVCVVVVLVAVGLVFVTGVPGVVVVVVPLVVVVLVDVPLVVVVELGVVFVPVVVVAEVPGGQFCRFVLVLVVVFVVGVVVVVGVVGVVGVVCAKAGTAMVTTSPATEARPRIARELMRLILLESC